MCCMVRDQLAVKAASRKYDSPVGLVITTCWGPTVSGGVVAVSVLISTKVVAAGRAPMVTVAPDWKPLPRMVSVVPPEAGPAVGEIAPMERGTAAS